MYVGLVMEVGPVLEYASTLLETLALKPHPTALVQTTLHVVLKLERIALLRFVQTIIRS